MESLVIIWTEGKTDRMHLTTAFQALAVGPRIQFAEYDQDLGDDQLLKQCEAYSRTLQPQPTIFIFDRDNPQVVAKIEAPGRHHRNWGNNVYSMAIPIPPHRDGLKACSIEHYYSDVELQTADHSGRRLYLATEFNGVSGRHLHNTKLSVGNKGKLSQLGDNVLRIIDSEVYNEANDNVALSKFDFAKYVSNGVGPFKQFDFENFKVIIKAVDEIVAAALGGSDLAFANLDSFLNSLEERDTSTQLAMLLEASIRLCRLAITVFIAAAVRVHEQRLSVEGGAMDKKMRPLRDLLLQNYSAPNLMTVQKLARNCYHLIGDDSHPELEGLHAMMAEQPLLGDLGIMLEQLEQLLPPSKTQPRILNRNKMRKPVLMYIVPELAKYEARISEIKSSESAGGTPRASADVTVWVMGLFKLLRIFSPLRFLTYRHKTIEQVRTDTGEASVKLLTFNRDGVTERQVHQKYNELPDDRLESYELVLLDGETEIPMDLYPFLIIKGSQLHYYSRTRSNGFEFSSPFGVSLPLISTKRRFGHLALRFTVATDRQGLFWAGVAPTVSETGVRANIPIHEQIIGRGQQIDDVMKDIIQIPNQNGIIYGPGGVGKTALLIQLSHLLYESPPDASRFNNIIWVSAKSDSYDPILEVKEPRSPQFQSIDNVLDAILEFHEIEDVGNIECNGPQKLDR